MTEKIRINSVSVYYNNFLALKDITIPVKENKITALIGPSGCGKSTLLRCINRMNDQIPGFRLTGEILLDGKDVYNNFTDLLDLRKRIGMVFQRPNPFPLSIYENVVYGLKVHGVSNKLQLQHVSEQSLVQVGLWDVLKDKLNEMALGLSLEQQQRLCLARVLAVNPEVILLDEPCSSLDPIATAKIEELLFNLKKQYTFVIVTHNMQQAARISDFTGLLWLGDLVEFGETAQMFTNPHQPRTQDYISGRYG